MKRRLGITVLLTMILSIAMITVKAQTSTPQQGGTAVFVGSSYNYMVGLHGGNSYAWTVTQTVGTSAAPTLTNEATRVVTILWNSPGTYRIDVEETTAAPASCSTTKSFIVEVIDNNSTITFASVDPTCATTDPTTTVSQTLTLTGGSAPWFLDYTITDVLGTTNTITGENVGTSKDFSNIFNNTLGGVPQVYTVTITNAYDNYGMKPSSHDFVVDGDIVRSFVVNQNPATSAIQHD